MPIVPAFLVVLGCGSNPVDAPVDPFRAEVIKEVAIEWTFDRDSQGWTAENQCTTSARDGHLVVRSTGEDPYFHCPVNFAGGQFVVEMRVRGRGVGDGVIYWATAESPRGQDKVSPFRLVHDDQWHTYEARFVADSRLTDVRIDPGTGPGSYVIDWIRLVRERPHPLSIRHVRTTDRHVRFQIRNASDDEVQFSVSGQTMSLGPQASMHLDRPVDAAKPLEAISIELRPDGLPAVGRTVFVYPSSDASHWLTRAMGPFQLRVAPEGTVARVERSGQLVAIVGPTVHFHGEIPVLEPVETDHGFRFRGDGVSVTLSVTGQELSVAIDSSRRCEGPVVRVKGPLEQGLLAGLEYLGKGERSSSKLDVETDEHLRYAPDPMKVTMPLMALVTDRSSVAMTWGDMELQPVFATPNFFDGSDDHRMALRGKRIEAKIAFDEGPLEEAILWAAEKRGLPPLPPAPRTTAEQWQLCMKALEGPLRTKDGWGHCVEPRWERQPFCDMASTVWRLTGDAPRLPRLARGGSHIRNDSIYFVTGRAGEWLQTRSAHIRGIINRQGADGSFRYTGKYARGHFENTASGICAQPAVQLLEFAWLTGDASALDAGIRTLEYMKRFRTPRGAQTWEVPLHTPDQLASAYLVWAYTRGYELTGNQQYLRLARKWALTGVPFVYLWSCHPTMAYATPPVYGATNWRAPAWFGLPVQWVGIVYAYSLTMLAPYDNSLDWNHIARGILIAGEQMQCPDGPHVGLLPDAFRLEGQQRLPAMINPCALVSLRMVLDGQLDSLAVAKDGHGRRVTAPFPVSIRNGRAYVHAKPGVSYQALIDGSRMMNLESAGIDALP